MKEFERFVQWAGGQNEAATLLGCSPELVYSIRKGRRTVSRATAKRIMEVGGKRFSVAKLLQDDATA